MTTTSVVSFQARRAVLALRPVDAGDRTIRLRVGLAWGAAMRFFLTRLHDWRATPEGALVKPKDPIEYERKLAVHRAGGTLFEALP